MSQANGQAPQKTKPPVKNETIIFRVLDSSLIAHTSAPVPVPTADRIYIQVPHELIDPHPLVRKWLNGVRKAKASDGYLALEDKGILTAKITRAQVDRCAILYDILLKEGEALGFAWSVGQLGTQVEVVGEKMVMRIGERLERYDMPRPKPRALKPGQPWSPDYSVINAPRHGWRPTVSVWQNHLVIPAKPGHGFDSDGRANDGAASGPQAYARRLCDGWQGHHQSFSGTIKVP